MSQYNKSILDNGVRVVTEAMPHLHSVTIGLWVDIGARNEMPDENGTCHFIEHMMFKGTKKRTAFEIAAELESLGGNINAFTSREQTCYFARILDEHLPVAVDLLSDMLLNSAFADDQIERERGVILEEINEVFDTPSEYVHDMFAHAMWQDNSLGQPILGPSEIVAGMKRDDLFGFLSRNYKAGRVLVAAAGNVDHDNLVDMLEKSLTLNPDQPVYIKDEPNVDPQPSKIVGHRDINQVHVCMGFPGYRYANPDKFALLMIHNILGGGMSSRLFQAVREELGYAYSVYTYQDFYKDAGIFGVYLGTDVKNVKQSIEVILAETEKMRIERISDKEIETSRQQLKGNLMLGLESTSARMNRLARHEFGYNTTISIEETLQKIDSVTVEDIEKASNEIFSADQMALAILGPVEDVILDEIDWSILSS